MSCDVFIAAIHESKWVQSHLQALKLFKQMKTNYIFKD